MARRKILIVKNLRLEFLSFPVKELFIDNKEIQDETARICCWVSDNNFKRTVLGLKHDSGL